MVDKYLEKLKRIQFRAGYKKGLKVKKNVGDDRDESNLDDVAKKILGDEEINSDSPFKDKSYVMGVANNLMKRSAGYEKGDALGTYSVLLGAQLYEKIGQGGRNSVKRKLLRAVEKCPDKIYTEFTEEFLKRNPTEEKGLERKVVGVVAGISLVVSLFFLSLNITGNVVGNLSQSSSNLIGGVLFVLGIAGALFYFRKRN